MNAPLIPDDRTDDYAGELFRLGNVRLVVSAFRDGWLVQKRRSKGRWLTCASCQTQCEVLRWWIALTGDSGAEVCRLPVRFIAKVKQ